MNRKLLIIALLLLPLTGFGQVTERDSIRVFYLGGQSNMSGFGENSDLPDSITSNLHDVWIFQGNPAPDEDRSGGVGKWEEIAPGHGWEFTTDGVKNNLSEFFGVELSFAKKIREYYPNEKIAIIKYARGGISIDSLASGGWGSLEPDYRGENGLNQYDHFLKTVHLAFDDGDIDNDGIEDYLIPSGIIWMQGESDGRFTEDIANRYFDHLKRIMDLTRAALHKDDLPIVIGKISDSGKTKSGKSWKHGELVQYAQEKYARTDPNAAIVRSTKSYGYYDAYHYDSKGYIDLGEKFAEAIYLLSNK